MAQDKQNQDPAALPAALRRDLEALYGGTLQVPEGLERDCLGRAGRTLAWYRRRRLVTRVLPLAAAAAAVLLLVFHFGGRREDLNRDGRVDILDAFTLARHLEKGAEAPEEWDLTGDGRVDREDLHRVAALAVSLGGEG